MIIRTAEKMADRLAKEGNYAHVSAFIDRLFNYAWMRDMLIQALNETEQKAADGQKTPATFENRGRPVEYAENSE